MVDMFEKEVQCTLCPDTFEPLIEPEEDKGAYLISVSYTHLTLPTKA